MESPWRVKPLSKSLNQTTFQWEHFYSEDRCLIISACLGGKGRKTVSLPFVCLKRSWVFIGINLSGNQCAMFDCHSVLTWDGEYWQPFVKEFSERNSWVITKQTACDGVVGAEYENMDFKSCFVFSQRFNETFSHILGILNNFCVPNLL